MSPEQLLQIFTEAHNTLREDYTKSQRALKKDIRDMIQDSNIGIHAKIIDEVDKIEVKIDTIISHQKRQNGMLGKHEEALQEMELDHTKIKIYQKMCPAFKAAKSWKLILGTMVVISLTTSYIYNSVSLIDIWEFIKEIL